MKVKTLLLSLIFLLLTNQSPANTLTLDPDRTVEVIDIIDGSILGEAQKLEQFSLASTDPIYLLINSPGGLVIAGSSFIDSMLVAKKRGAPLICITGIMAASMAFNILVHCDERYALRHAKLLFHPIRIRTSQPLTARMLLEAYRDLNRYEKYLQGGLRHMLGVSREWFSYHYRAETMWEAEQLIEETRKGWLSIVDDVKGTDKLFTIDRPRGILRLELQQRGPYELVYQK